MFKKSKNFFLGFIITLSCNKTSKMMLSKKTYSTKKRTKHIVEDILSWMEPNAKTFDSKNVCRQNLQNNKNQYHRTQINEEKIIEIKKQSHNIYLDSQNKFNTKSESLNLFNCKYLKSKSLDDDKFKFRNEKICFIESIKNLRTQMNDNLSIDTFKYINTFSKSNRIYSKLINDIYNIGKFCDVKNNTVIYRYQFIKFKKCDTDQLFYIRYQRYKSRGGFILYKFDKISKPMKYNFENTDGKNFFTSRNVIDLNTQPIVAKFDLRYNFEFHEKFTTKICKKLENKNIFKKTFLSFLKYNIRGIYPYYSKPDGKINFLVACIYDKEQLICNLYTQKNKYLLKNVWKFSEKTLDKILAFSALFNLKNNSKIFSYMNKNQKDIIIIPNVEIIKDVEDKNDNLISNKKGMIERR